MATTLMSVLENIPATFWGVVVGSFFSLAGVYLANRASDNRLRKQFDHERIQKSKDREMILKKEVFLAASDAIAAGMNAIGRYANFELPDNQITSDYSEKAPAISKVHVIANTKTVQEITNFTGELGVVFLKLIAKRLELMSDKNQLQALDDQIKQYARERDRILEMMKQHNIEGVVDMHRWNILQENFDNEQNRINDASKHHSELAMSFYPRQLKFMQECVSETGKLGKLLVPLLSSVRHELELPFDEKAYRQVTEDGISKQELAIEEFVKKFMPFVEKQLSWQPDEVQ